MNTLDQIKLKLNPNYINKISDEELNEEIVMYALNCGFKYENDTHDRYCKYYDYIVENLKKDSRFIKYLIRSKTFNKENFTKDQMEYIFDFIFSEDPSLIIDAISANSKFLEFLDSEDLIKKLDASKLCDVLLKHNIKYIDLSTAITKNNIELGLKYLEQDFSNITIFKNNISNYEDFSEQILDIFMKNINKNIEYINEIVEIIPDDPSVQKSINEALRETNLEITDSTPSFLLKDKNIVLNVILNNPQDSIYIKEQYDFNSEESMKIVDAIKEKATKFKSIPQCFANNKEIIRQILLNNPDILNSYTFNYDYKLMEDILYNLIIQGDYEINEYSNPNVLQEFFKNAKPKKAIDIIDKYFYQILNYISDVDLKFADEYEDKIYEICEKNNYSLSKESPLFLKRNTKLVYNAIKNEQININDVDLEQLGFNNDQKMNLIDFCHQKNIDNEVVNKWRNQFFDKLRSTSTNTNIDGALYLNNDIDLYTLKLPTDITEVHFQSFDIEKINALIAKIKNENPNIKTLAIDLPIDKTFSNEELNKITDKDMVRIISKDAVTKFSVSDLIKLNNIMDLMVSEIKASNLSPYEKYIAVYNTIKSWKNYKYYQNNKIIDFRIADQSRNPYLVLINDYIVCAGYSRLLNELLKRVGINSIECAVRTNELHDRNYVNLVDPKYDINGFYMCDVTADNTQTNIMSYGYNYLHQTTEQSRNDSSVVKGSINDNLFNDYTDEELLKYIQNNCASVKEQLSMLDPEFYSTISNDIDNITLDTVSKINAYLKTKINKKIPIEKDLAAIFELNQFISGKHYESTEAEEKWNDMVLSISLPGLVEKETYFKGDYKSLIEKNIEQIENDNFQTFLENSKEYEKSPYKKYCYNSAYQQLLKRYLATDLTNIYFSMENQDNNIILRIDMDYHLTNTSDRAMLIDALKKMGYTVEEPQFTLNINLGSSSNKTVAEILSICELAKNDFENSYKNIFPPIQK